MAGLIDKNKAKEMFPDNGEGSWTYNVTAKAYLDTLPTITEEEIRAKAIEEFAERIKGYAFGATEIIDRVAKELKGE